MEWLEQIFEVIGEWSDHVWRFRIATVENNDITVANVTIGLIVFFVGIKLARKISDFIVKIILRKTQLDPNSRESIKALVFYILVAVFLLTAMEIAQIPIKIFAVLGGALAIGVGFGSQNLIKDFINGLVLMIEEPVRVGDMIEIDAETRGQIRRIGAISTHILTFRNVDILVPNSSLIENTVINWTLTDRIAKRILSVGVAYGSPTKKVEELLVQAAEEHPTVLNDRKAKAYFVDFGDSTLNFELYYWIPMNRPGDERQVASDLRHRIVELFEEHSIEIAFPQRDVHLDASESLPVKIVQS